MFKILEYLKIDFRDLENPELMKSNLIKNSGFYGANIWILVCAIFIASLGLNANSTAVIIGAMLISPLMSPIIGIGFGLGTYDLNLVKKSFRYYITFVSVSLIASFLFFSVSPIIEASSEILSRTRPTISDVMIAFFGGFAGMLAIMSKRKGNVIPGAAIATALMPPLCVAGYGAAAGSWHYFAGALYLLTINTVFIAFASLLTVRILKIPIYHASSISSKQSKRIKTWLGIILFLTILPSIYLGFIFYKEDQFKTNAEKFINAETQFGNTYKLSYNIIPSEKIIEVVFGGSKISESQKEILRSKLRSYHLNNADLIIRQGFSFEKNAGAENVAQFGKLSSKLNDLTKENYYLKNQIKSINESNATTVDIRSELKTLFPTIKDVYIANKIEKSSKNGSKELISPYFIWIDIPRGVAYREGKKISSWLQTRLKDSVITKFNEY